MQAFRAMAWVVLAMGFVGETRADILAITDHLAHFFSRDARKAEIRLERLKEELAGLPSLLDGPQGSRYGFRSGTLFEQNQEHWVQLDLGKNYQIDGLVAMPAHIPTLGKQGEGYGFPNRFKIEVAENSEMRNAVMVVDRTAEDVKNPGRYPMVFWPKVVLGRYVRFTSTKHISSTDGFFWAMEELMVLSGNRNVAAGSLVSASSHLDLFPNWALNRIIDSQSALGIPVSLEGSPTNGYLSAASDLSRTEKWLVVDLGEELEIDEIRLIAVESEDYEVVGGRGFPKDLVLEFALDSEFETKVWQMKIASHFLGYPWGCPLVMPCMGSAGRYIRIMTKELWARDKLHSFALAELQAYSGGKNVALGKSVHVKDSTNRADATLWAPEFVVDGYTSDHRLLEIPTYLKLIDRRGKLLHEQTQVSEERDRKVKQLTTILSVGGGSFGGIALLGWLWMIVRQRAVRRRDAVRLREQIARDLHDDIGSNLGGIVLLSEIGSRHQELDEQSRKDFQSIKEAAEETSESMQDIVWLIQPDNMGLREMVLKMRESIERMLGNPNVSVVVEPAEFRNPHLSLMFRRHVFFAFKETLNNVRRHAAATHVDVHIAITARHLSFTVKDNGMGFDLKTVSQSGHGLRNLRRRAERLKGTYRLESAPGHGTTASFKAHLKS